MNRTWRGAGALLLLIAAACDGGADPADANASTATATPAAEQSATAEAAPAAAVQQTAARAAATPGQDWTATVAMTPEGGFRMGNPDAPVKLIEFASLTCPHCASFHQEGLAKLRSDYIATGRVSYELRNFVLNGPDLAATLLARCQGPAAFFRLADDFFTRQEQWVQPFTTLSPEEQQRLQSLPADRQLVGMADAAGLDDFMRQRGMPKAKFEACLTDQKAIDQLASIRKEAIDRYNLTGTPTFVINGETQDVTTWSALEPRLRTALQ